MKLAARTAEINYSTISLAIRFSIAATDYVRGLLSFAECVSWSYFFDYPAPDEHDDDFIQYLYVDYLRTSSDAMDMWVSFDEVVAVH